MRTSSFILSSAGYVALICAACSITSCANIIGIEEPNTDTCHQYCDLVAAQCDGANVAQFIGHSPDTKVAQDGKALTPHEQQRQCLTYCDAMLKSNNPQAVDGNTIACRIAILQSQEQTSSRAQKCEDAGPASLECVDVPITSTPKQKLCATYCELYDQTCLPLVSQKDPCSAGCNSLEPGTLPYTIGSAGDTIKCRIYHNTVSLIEAPEVHCGHASLVSAMSACSDN